MRANQTIFEAFEGMFQESKVRKLNRFAASAISERSSKFTWSGEAALVAGAVGAMRAERLAVGGKLLPVAYRNWLAFYTPLCDRGATL